ncbi:MAG: DUF3179 domain-containing (seleno)protein, partial [Myxococcota bacterium]|nr:DUF3179 domain-containing (seleno)protein [Myxococcota bacterium]
GELDAVYETPDVPYAIYTVNQDGRRLGYAFGTNQRGTFSNIQVVAVTNAEGALQVVYVQKLRSPDHALLKGEDFTAALAAVPLADYPGLVDCYARGKCQAVPVKDPTSGRQASDFRAILRALAKLHHVRELLLRPGAVPTYRDDRAMAEYAAAFWVPEQGFRPLDHPEKVSVDRAAEHILDPGALVAALLGGDRTTLYPISLLTAHPVMQDTFDDQEVTIAWSSPSHTLSVLTSDQEPPLRFSNTANLLFGHQTLLERRSRSEWSPVLGRVVQGAAPSGAVRHVPGAVVLPWQIARALFPGARVAIPSDTFSKHKPFYAAHRDRFDLPLARRRVLVLSDAGERVVIDKETLVSEPFLSTRVGETPVLVVSDAGMRGVYAARIDGRPLHFELYMRDTETGAGLLRDTETGSIWEGITGRAVAGPLAGARLRPVVFQEMPEGTAAALFPGAT